MAISTIEAAQNKAICTNHKALCVSSSNDSSRCYFYALFDETKACAELSNAYSECFLRAKLYPSKHSDIEARLVKDGDEKALTEFEKKYPSSNGRFDLAYMQKKFSTVISVSQDADLTAVRKVKLAISYIYQNQPENALTINSEIKSQQLQQLIFLALIHEGKLDQAATLAKSMNNKDADKVLEVGKTYQAAYDKAKADANNPKLSETDRQQAIKDQHNWLALRKSLGGKSPYEESTNE